MPTRFLPPEKQYKLDEQNRAKHIRAAQQVLQNILPQLATLVDTSLDGDEAKRDLSKKLKDSHAVRAFLDTYITTEPEYASWRNTLIYRIRDFLLGLIKIKDLKGAVENYASKGFETKELAVSQDALRKAIPTEILEYMPDKIVVDVDPDGTIARVTDRFENERFTLEKKTERMMIILKQYNQIVELVRRDMQSSDEKTKLAALITAIIMETGIRPGKEGNAANVKINGEKVEVETFGATTLGPQHVRFIRDNFASLEFVGKKGSINTASLSDAAIIQVLNSYVERALTRGSKFIFVTEDGVPFDYRDLEKYFRSRFKDISPTDFRKLRATDQVFQSIARQQAELHAEIRAAVTKGTEDLKGLVVREVVKVFNNAVLEAQAALSHDNADTTRKSYINPRVILNFLSTGRVSATLADAILDGKTTLAFDPKRFVDVAFGKAASASGGETLRGILQDLGQIELIDD